MRDTCAVHKNVDVFGPENVGKGVLHLRLVRNIAFLHLNISAVSNFTRNAFRLREVDNVDASSARSKPFDNGPPYSTCTPSDHRYFAFHSETRRSLLAQRLTSLVDVAVSLEVVKRISARSRNCPQAEDVANAFPGLNFSITTSPPYICMCCPKHKRAI